MERASGRAGVIQDGVGLVETCKSEAGSLIQPTSASRYLGRCSRQKTYAPGRQGEMVRTTLHLQSDKTIAWHGNRQSRPGPAWRTQTWAVAPAYHIQGRPHALACLLPAASTTQTQNRHQADMLGTPPRSQSAFSFCLSAATA